MDALLIEAELLLDWYLPRFRRQRRRRRARRLSARCGARRSRPCCEAPPTWVLRDYHSPNLLWLPEREGHRAHRHARFPGRRARPRRLRLASLLQDARVDVPEMMEIALLVALYARAPLTADATFDAPAFARAYATLAAQRASKILGIFARLDRARRQAAISASHAARMGLSAALAGASGAGAARRPGTAPMCRLKTLSDGA